MGNLTPAQIGILEDIQKMKVDADNISDWMRQQLGEIIFSGPELLIDTKATPLKLTAAGEVYIQTILRDRRVKRQ